VSVVVLYLEARMFDLFRKKNIFDDPELNGHIIAIRLILNHVVRNMPEEHRTELLETLNGVSTAMASRNRRNMARWRDRPS
jgi:hypothetical protein